MKRKPIKITAMLLCCVMLVGVFAGCKDNSIGSTSPQASDGAETEIPETSENIYTDASELTRANYVKQLEEVEEFYKQNPADQDVTLQYSQILYVLGEFDQSREILNPLLEEETSLPDATYLSAQLDYLTGNYDQAEKQYKTLVEEHYDEYGLAAEVGLQMVYYQTNEYSKASQLFVGQDLENPLLDMMKAFVDTTPYQIDWNGNEQTAIPFVTTDPLPVVPIEINGVKMNAFIDTGAPMLTVDETIAVNLGIEIISNGVGEGGGGTADISFGKADSMKLRGVDILNIPVMLTSLEGGSGIFKGYATDVHAIIGTNVLQQFIPIMDYPSGQLILMPRNEAGKTHLRNLLANDNVSEKIPFTLADTHYMFAQGSINGYAGLNMFVDSGMDDSKGAGIELSKETMDLLGIPMPELTPGISSGLGGSDYEQGWFDLPSYGLGNLQMKQGIGIYDTSDVLSGWIDTAGFSNDALISHNYLKQYKWTIDFDSMTMTFSK